MQLLPGDSFTPLLIFQYSGLHQQHEFIETYLVKVVGVKSYS